MDSTSALSASFSSECSMCFASEVPSKDRSDEKEVTETRFSIFLLTPLNAGADVAADPVPREIDMVLNDMPDTEMPNARILDANKG